MITFWSLVCLMTALALLFVVPTLWRKPVSGHDGAALSVAVYRRELDELDADLQADRLTADTYALSRHELEHRLLQDTAAIAPVPEHGRPGSRTAALLVLASFPVLAFAIYLELGQPQAVSADEPSKAALSAGDAGLPAVQLGASAESAAQAAQGWYEQARAQMGAGNYALAVQAYASTVALLPGSAALLAEYAEAVTLMQGRDPRGRPAEIVHAALNIDPWHQRSLALAATAASASGDYLSALAYWERLQATLPPNSDNARMVAASIARARGAVVRRPGEAASPPSLAVTAATALRPEALSGTIRLSPTLRAKLEPQAALYIYARLEDGSRTPLAVVRTAAHGLPARFVLDDTAAMEPTRTLSTARTALTVGARISQTGDPAVRSGDLQGFTKGARAGQAGIEILIDSVVP